MRSEAHYPGLLTVDYFAAKTQIRALIALGILEAVEACTRASEMVECLDGTCIHDNDWDAVEP